MKYIIPFHKVSEEMLPYCGGKGASLVRITDMGMPVPDGVIILSKAFEGVRMIPEAERELAVLMQSLSSKITYAVRSSALNEDGESASFAGAYETVTDVEKQDILSAVKRVISSADNIRVKSYAQSSDTEHRGMAVVIQRFVKPSFAGVVFTSHMISGSSAVMSGNYVRGEGELLVSGVVSAEEFTFNTMKYAYDGNREFKKYAKRLYKLCASIRNGWGCPMDIEWAVSAGRIYILQARPITTLKRLDKDKFIINGSLAGEYLLSKTNVGEIFMRPVSPMTFSVLESICEMMGIPCFIDNVCGQAYANLSVICSLMVSFGVSEKSAYNKIKEIAGNLPEGVTVPVFPFDRKNFLRRIKKLVFSGMSNKMNKVERADFSERIADIADEMRTEIRQIADNEALFHYWVLTGSKFMSAVLSTILKGVNVVPLFATQKRIAGICGEELANALCAGGAGMLDSMKPLLLIEDVISGKIAKENYVKICGHRSANEMELSAPYPYENPDFPDNVIEEHRKSGANIHRMKAKQEEKCNAAVQKFKALYPQKSKWLDATLEKFRKANYAREDVRSKGVKLFCVMREFLLKAGELNGIGDDIFMLYFPEVMRLLKGDVSVLKNIPFRRKNYEKYLSYPPFPNLICGRFSPEEWLSSDGPRHDFYSVEERNCVLASDVKGFPGAAGTVTGKARVIYSLDDAEELLQGEILVTPATNIGWTVIFPKAAAIITDIGAPLSHAAIVAREFGIPAVVGCGNATTVLKTGDIVTVDGFHGTVTIHR